VAVGTIEGTNAHVPRFCLLGRRAGRRVLRPLSQQFTHGEDNAEDAGDAEGPERPDEEQSAARLGGLVDVRASQVDERHSYRKDRDKDHDDAAGQPLTQHQRRIKKPGQDRDAYKIHEPGRVEPMRNVVRHMDRQQNDRHKRRDR
jgi:hypothetical protein